MDKYITDLDISGTKMAFGCTLTSPNVIQVTLRLANQGNRVFQLNPISKHESPYATPEYATTYVDKEWSFEFDKLDKANTKVGHGTPDCNDCDEFERIVDLPGEVVSVRCVMGPGSHNNTAYCDKVGDNQAKWKFYTNDGNHQSMTFHIVYKKPVSNCVKNCPSNP